jgi:N-acetylglucosaminyldiphosphoundecaprenol N-acetyl-beta-D-mannosaminyltransferase
MSTSMDLPHQGIPATARSRTFGVHKAWLHCRPLAGRLLENVSSPKRMLDLGFTLAVSFALAPLLAVMCVLAWKKVVRLRRTRRVGRHGHQFFEFSWQLNDENLHNTENHRSRPLRALGRLPVLLNILRGEMSWVGPRAVSPEDRLLRESTAQARFRVLPGVVGLHSVREEAHLDYGHEIEADRDYLAAQSLRNDLIIFVRALPGLLFGRRPFAWEKQVTILGVRMDNMTENEALAKIVDRLNGPVPSQVCFVNADCLNIAQRDAAYRRIVNRAPLTLTDGIGLKLAGKMLGSRIRENVNGTDLFPRLCQALAESGHGLFLLGGKPGVADEVVAWVSEHYPRVRLCGARDGYYLPAEEAGVVQQIRESGASLLLVAMGTPKQEKWLQAHLRETGVKVGIGVGGLFDFYSGRMPRAPLWMRQRGLEWLFRFYQEPRRLWKRYLIGNGLFLLRVAAEKLRRATVNPALSEPEVAEAALAFDPFLSPCAEALESLGQVGSAALDAESGAEARRDESHAHAPI